MRRLVLSLQSPSSQYEVESIPTELQQFNKHYVIDIAMLLASARSIKTRFSGALMQISAASEDV